jgi:hypothetical protein
LQDTVGNYFYLKDIVVALLKDCDVCRRLYLVETVELDNYLHGVEVCPKPLHRALPNIIRL